MVDGRLMDGWLMVEGRGGKVKGGGRGGSREGRGKGGMGICWMEGGC